MAPSSPRSLLHPQVTGVLTSAVHALGPALPLPFGNGLELHTKCTLPCPVN